MQTDDESLDTQTTTLQSAIAGVLHNANAIAAGENPLKGHPGKSIDIFWHGLPRLHAHAVLRGLDGEGLKGTAKEQMLKGDPLCESPIERNLLAALLTGSWAACPEGHPLVHNAKDYSEAFPHCPIVIVPQMAILRYRADIGIVAKRSDGTPSLFAIECDGKEFHKDAERDRLRDVYFAMLGVKVLRVTGRVLNEWPIAVADEIIGSIDGWIR